MNVRHILLYTYTYLITCTLGLEPECSRFSYDEKLLEKMIKMEVNMGNSLDENRDQIGELTNEISTLKRGRAEMLEAISTMKEELEILRSEQSAFLTKENLGSTYVRWGSTVCPSTASRVYKGYIGGRHYTEAGSGTNNICLPSDPTWLNYVDGVQNSGRGYVYGTEIDSHDQQNIFSTPVNQQDLPCAVCQSKKSTTIMIPARKDCYGNWTMEYRGYLVTAYHGQGGNEYICLNENPEFVMRGEQNDNQHILYLVESRCGSLPCPPYVEGREVACVVCSL